MTFFPYYESRCPRAILGPFCFRSGDVPLEVANPVSTELSQLIEQVVWGRVMGSKRIEILWNANFNGLPRSSLGMIKTASDKTGMFSKGKAMIAYPAHVLLPTFTAKRRRSSINHAYTIFRFLPAGSAEAETEDIEGKAYKDVSQYKPTTLKVVPLEKLISHTSSTSSQNDQITGLKKAVHSILAPLRNFSETGFRVFLKDRKVWRCSPEVVPYCCNIPEDTNTSSA